MPQFKTGQIGHAIMPVIPVLGKSGINGSLQVQSQSGLESQRMVSVFQSYVSCNSFFLKLMIIFKYVIVASVSISN